MKTLPVGIQIFSVREDAAKDFKGTLQKLKKAGYDFVELAGLYDMEPSAVRAVLDEVGLPAISAHVPYAELVADPEGTLDKYKIIGCRYIVFPHLTEDLRQDSPNFPNTLSHMRRICEIAREKGFLMLYHNHDFEFVVMPDGRFGLDYTYEEIGLDRLQSELDTCWIKVAGQDPAAYIRKYAGHCPIVHLKDFYKEGTTHDMYELIGVEKKAAENQAEGFFEFRPLGCGMQDVPSLLTASIEAGAEYVVVEQDASNGRPPMEAVTMSRDYLRSLGW